MKRRAVAVIVVLAGCHAWDTLERQAVSCLAGCDAGASGGGAGGGGPGAGGGAVGGGTGGGPACGLTGNACTYDQTKPEGSIAWKRTFPADAGSGQIAIASNGCSIYVLTAVEGHGHLAALALDGSDACDLGTFPALADAGLDLAARGNTVAGLWNTGAQSFVHITDAAGGAAMNFPLPFDGQLVQVSDGDGGIFAIGTTSSGIQSRRINGATASPGPTWTCDQAHLGSLTSLEAGSFLVSGWHSGVVGCSLNGFDVSYESGFLMALDGMAIGTGTASNTRAASGFGGIYFLRNATDDPHYGELSQYDLSPTFPGSAHQSAAWNSIDGGGFVTPVAVAGSGTEPTAWMVLATDAELRFTTSFGSYSVPGVGGLVVKVTDTRNGTIAWVTPIGGSGELPTHAVLLANQLLVAGTCGDATSDLCPTPHGVWLISISP